MTMQNSLRKGLAATASAVIAAILFPGIFTYAPSHAAENLVAATVPFADNLVIEGVPNPTRALIDEVTPYSFFRFANFLSWHPQRREMLIQTRFSDSSQVHLVKFPGGARTQLTFFKDSPQAAQYQPVRGETFEYEKDTDGDENSQEYLFDLKTGKSRLLSDGKSRNNGALWSNKGDRICYCSTRRNGADDDVYVVNADDSKTDHLLSKVKGGQWEVFDWSPDDKTLLLNEFVTLEQRNLILIDTTSGEQVSLTPFDGKNNVVYSAGKFSKDGAGVYTTTDKDSDFQRLAYVDIKTKEHTYLTTDIPWDIEMFALSDDGKRIAAIANEDGISKLHLYDTSTMKELKAPALPIGVVYNIGWHKNNKDLAIGFEDSKSPTDVYSLDMDSGKFERWTASETAGMDTSTFSEAKLVHWKSFDNREISGFLYSPAREKFPGKRPVIIDIHGGPAGQSRPGFLYRNSYYVNELGVAFLYPNIRGSTGYGKKFMGLDNVLKREDAYKDIGALLDWIRQQPDLDSDRVMVTGESYGGHMTLSCAHLYSDKIRCAIDQVGQANFVTQLENTASYGRDIRRAEYGDERDPSTRAFLEKIAPVNNASKIKKPLFVVAGKNDPRVPASESQQIVKAVKAVGTPVWFLMANDEGHGFHQRKNQDALFYAKVEFIKTFLLGQ